MTVLIKMSGPVVAQHTALFYRYFSWMLFGYPILWAIGLGGLFWPLLAVAGVFYLVGSGMHRRSAWVPMCVFMALLLSSVIGSIFFGFQVSRLISLLGNGAVWVGLAALISMSGVADLRSLVRRGFAFIAGGQGTIIGIAAIIYPSQLELPLLREPLSALPSGIAAFATGRLFYQDWLGEATFRSAGMMANPTWCGAVGAIGILCGLACWKGAKLSKYLGLFAILGGFISLYYSLSRAGWAILIGACLCGLLIIMSKVVSRVAFFGLITSGLLLASAVAVIAAPHVPSVFDEINNERAGSAITRSAIYARTLELLSVLPVPVLGFGIKPQEDELVASVATHSTYLGLLFRAGLIGLMLFSILLLRMLAATFRNRDALGFAVVAFMVIWCILEDFDGGHLLPIALLLAYKIPKLNQNDV